MRLKTWLPEIEKAGDHRGEVEGIYNVYIHAGELGDWPVLVQICCQEELGLRHHFWKYLDKRF